MIELLQDDERFLRNRTLEILSTLLERPDTQGPLKFKFSFSGETSVFACDTVLAELITSEDIDLVLTGLDFLDTLTLIPSASPLVFSLSRFSGRWRFSLP